MNSGPVGNLADIWISRKKELKEQLAEERKKADAIAQKLCDGVLANWSGIEAFEIDPEHVVKLALDVPNIINGVRASVIKDAVDVYINSSNNEELDVVFSCAKSDVEFNQVLLLITKKEQPRGDK